MFTKRQRLAIRARDDQKCQAPFPHKCGGRFEVHHLLPQRFCREILGLTDVEIDRPENALTICANAHRIIHPDLDVTLVNYKYMKEHGKEPFLDMAKAREDKLKNRQIYWNDEYDRQMLAHAFARTAKARRKGWTFPERRKNSHRKTAS